MGRSLIPKGGNDRIMTPNPLAQFIVDYYRPLGSVLEPCSGDGAFIRAFLEYKIASYKTIRPLDFVFEIYSCEIDEGTDFFDVNNADHFDWIITNPPYSKFTAFLKHSMEVADNVVFLCLENAFFQKARLRAMKEHDFGFREILHVDTPPKPWPQFGLQVGVVHIQRGYKGDTKISYADKT